MPAAPASVKKLNRELKRAKQMASKRIFDQPAIRAAQAQVQEADLEVQKAEREVKKAKRALKRVPKPPKTLLQKFFAGGRGGGGGGGAGGFQVNKISGRLQRRNILQ